MNEARFQSQLNATIARAFDQRLRETQSKVDRIFMFLLPAEWVFAILLSLIISPYAWESTNRTLHIHLVSAVTLGGLLTALPVWLTIYCPGKFLTRVAVASAQLLFSALFIHLMAGRIEAHFHVFISMAILSSYRDRRLYIPAVAVVTVDHLLRGVFWPMSAFGVAEVDVIRPIEHAAWLVFEVSVLWVMTGDSLKQLYKLVALEQNLAFEQKKLESRVQERTAELQEAHEFQDTILNALEARIGIVAPDGNLIFSNQNWKSFSESWFAAISASAATSNYFEQCNSAKELLKSRPSTLIEIECYIGSIRRVLNGSAEHEVFEYEVVKLNKKHWFQVLFTPVTLNGARCVAIVHVDISDTKLAQADATSLANLILTSPNEVYIFDRDDLSLIECSDGACQNLGYSKSELQGLTAIDLQPNLVMELLRYQQQQSNLCEQIHHEYKTKQYRKDSSSYPCFVSLYEGAFSGRDVYVAFVSDLTQRQQYEDRLNQAKKLESLGQLAAGIAHEINTPMQCVFGNVEFLQSSCERLFAVTDAFSEILDQQGIEWESQRLHLQNLRKQYRYEYLRKQTPMAIEEAAEASKKIISIVRAMKIISHPGTHEKVLANINELIENAATITKNRWKYVAELKLSLQNDLPKAEILTAEISQVLINLLVNAGDAIAEKLGESPSKLGVIEVKTFLDGDQIQIQLSDSGCGISNEHLSRIYDPFFTTKEVGKGTGQGLSIGYDVIVNKHGGTIDVTSELGIGTTFTILIPVQEPKPKPKPKPAIVDQFAATTDSIAFID